MDSLFYSCIVVKDCSAKESPPVAILRGAYNVVIDLSKPEAKRASQSYQIRKDLIPHMEHGLKVF